MVMSDETANFFYIMRSWGMMRELKKKNSLMEVDFC